MTTTMAIAVVTAIIPDNLARHEMGHVFGTLLVLAPMRVVESLGCPRRALTSHDKSVNLVLGLNSTNKGRAPMTPQAV